jgi:hypothetical protein
MPFDAEGRPPSPAEEVTHAKRDMTSFHATEQRPPESTRPGTWRRSGLFGLCPAEGAVVKAVCADRLRGASSERRVHVTVSEAVGKRSCSAPRSSLGGPWITARFRIKLDPCGSSCRRSRKLAFPGRLFAAGSASAPARRPTTSLPAERSRACRAGTPPWRLRRWSSSSRQSNRAHRGAPGLDRQDAFEAWYVVAVVHTSASSRCRTPSGNLRPHRS